MNDFLICFGLMGLLFVPFILMFLLCAGSRGNKIGGALFCLIFWFAFSGAMYAESKWDNEMWNGGICSMCEGEYNFSGATKYRTTHSYYYTCDDCGHTIELNTLKK